MSTHTHSPEEDPNPHNPPSDLIKRGSYSLNTPGTATFIGLRTLDPLLQYSLLAHGTGSTLLTHLGLTSLPLHAHPPWDYLSYATLPKDSAHILTTLETVSPSDLPVSRLILLAMATGSTLKQVYWLLFVSREDFPPASAAIVSVYNTILNTVASLCLLNPTSSSALATPRVPVPFRSDITLSLPTAVGIVLYVVGMALETVSEVQRRDFKKDGKNKGKVMTTGLWKWARHVNYGGYTLWRTGYGLAAGGWALGAAMAGWHAWTFVKRSIPELRKYMVERYQGQWEAYERQVKWQLLPGIY
ncbi:hypothetical protein B0T14DRAFT_233951 [Immersiella caudata]|uniref:Steroid 5-alpha reductase C-terminal domain-containing protein n=1 Tax=Immersiella caudata TaxID=314043 RepID=A0AA40C0L6_9PEZI|nr:hypothetical protein B0T14DRAFT_233951 [Immersiella caudata]